MNPVVIVEIYQGRKRFRQAWRWRARNKANGEVMASGEAYTNEADCYNAVVELFGDSTRVWLASGNLDVDDVIVREPVL